MPQEVKVYKGVLYLHVPKSFSIFPYFNRLRVSPCPMMFEHVKNLMVHESIIAENFPPPHRNSMQVYHVAVASTDHRSILNRLSELAKLLFVDYPACNLYFIRINKAYIPSYYFFDDESNKLMQVAKEEEETCQNTLQQS